MDPATHRATVLSRCRPGLPFLSRLPAPSERAELLQEAHRHSLVRLHYMDASTHTPYRKRHTDYSSVHITADKWLALMLCWHYSYTAQDLLSIRQCNLVMMISTLTLDLLGVRWTRPLIVPRSCPAAAPVCRSCPVCLRRRSGRNCCKKHTDTH